MNRLFKVGDSILWRRHLRTSEKGLITRYYVGTCARINGAGSPVLASDVGYINNRLKVDKVSEGVDSVIVTGLDIYYIPSEVHAKMLRLIGLVQSIPADSPEYAKKADEVREYLFKAVTGYYGGQEIRTFLKDMF